MTLYCIRYMQMYDDDNTEHFYYCYAQDETNAIKRFCVVTENKKGCIISIHKVGD